VKPLGGEAVAQIGRMGGWVDEPEELHAARTEKVHHSRHGCVGVSFDTRPDDAVVRQVPDGCLEPENAVFFVQLALGPVAEHRPVRDEGFLDLRDDVHPGVSDHRCWTKLAQGRFVAVRVHPTDPHTLGTCS